MYGVYKIYPYCICRAEFSDDGSYFVWKSRYHHNQRLTFPSLLTKHKRLHHRSYNYVLLSSLSFFFFSFTLFYIHVASFFLFSFLFLLIICPCSLITSLCYNYTIVFPSFIIMCPSRFTMHSVMWSSMVLRPH